MPTKNTAQPVFKKTNKKRRLKMDFPFSDDLSSYVQSNHTPHPQPNRSVGFAHEKHCPTCLKKTNKNVV
ncbi:hypothetical protein HMPREF9418_1361 [Neisseria macacae ATCC 33926]|uniref:Uncharacterized protein n=1 Tax=Neisseria macacae ATCC 33926 TaxID=997348 RepID=A0AA36UJE3_9NEIS|nr:hypothetical protein HMPREF9418_1361 [Neisseria macacae ATCC 33926]